MSDFLDQFINEAYHKNKPTLTSQAQSHNDKENNVQDQNHFSKRNIESNHENNNYLKDEVIEVDPEFKKKNRRKKIIIICLSILALSILGVFYNKANHKILPDFVDVERFEVDQWAKKNNVDIIYTENFSTQIEKDHIISQEVEPFKKIKKGSTINMSLSLGPDPEETIPLPDFSKMMRNEIDSWIQENKMQYIQLEQIYSTDVDKDYFIQLEIKDKDVSAESFKRKNKATVTVSKGKEVFEKNIQVPDFKNKTKSEVELWITDKGFINKAIFEEIYHDEKQADEVISQSVNSGEKVSKDDILTFEISKGKAITAPDYSQTELVSFDTINAHGASVISKEIYTMTYAYGSFVEQSVSPGTIMNDNPELTIVVYYSIGKPFIKDLVGQSEGDLPAFFYEFKGKGANIEYNSHYISDCTPKGTVVRASKNNEFLNTEDVIDVYISTGSQGCEIPIE